MLVMIYSIHRNYTVNTQQEIKGFVEHFTGTSMKAGQQSLCSIPTSATRAFIHYV